MEKDKKIDELEKLLKKEEYTQHLIEFQKMIDNSDNN